MLDYFAHLAKENSNTEMSLEVLSKKEISLRELTELQNMDRTSLLGLMKFCDIRVYEGTPMVACTDDEMRLAYVLWRGHLIKERKEKFNFINRKLRELNRLLVKYIQANGGIV